MPTSKQMLVISFFIAFAVSLAPAARAVPMWSRRYSVPCSTCHAYPSLQLTAAGLDFFRKGHRFDSDTFDKDFSHLLSAHIETQYQVAQGTATQFTTPEFHIHAGGAVSEYFSTYVDAMTTGEFESISLQATKIVNKDEFVTARAGKVSPTIIRNYANGLMASASTPMIITDTTLGSNPFTPARGSNGLTAAAGWKSLFFEGGVVNGEDIPGQVAVNRHKDTFASGELALPDGISGIGLYTFRGGYDIEDPSIAAFDRYNRNALFANFTRDKFRVAGAYVTGKDTIANQPEGKIRGYYVQTDLQATGKVAPFARWESTRTDTGSEVDRQRKGTLGVALNAFQNDVSAARVVFEGARTNDGGSHNNSVLIGLLLAF
jgi:hypothetical protein